MNDFHQIEDFFASPRKKRNEMREKWGFWSRLKERLPSKEQLLYLPHVLSLKERYTITGLIILAVVSFIFIPVNTYRHYTNVAPGYGGSYIEGLLSTPSNINPLLAGQNDVDRDINKLIYAGLMKYNDKGELDYDLAGSYTTSNDELTYTFRIRDNARWQDGIPVTSDDIIFTIYTLQNPTYNSPLRALWQGVEVNKKDAKTVSFTLKNKYAQFINTLTLGILPKHIWENISPADFGKSELNLKPIGSGPYKFNKIKRDNGGTIKSYELLASDTYYAGRPYITTIIFKFYPTEEDMIKAYNAGDVEGISLISSNNLASLRFVGRLNLNKIKVPRYFAVFYNQSKNQALSDKVVRQAIAYATDRDAIIKDQLHSSAIPVTNTLLDSILGYKSSDNSIGFNSEKAKTILDQGGWINNGTDGIREKTTAQKEKVPLRIEITTSNWPELVSVANSLKTQWSKVGIELVIRSLSTTELQQVTRNRDYEALLFGEVLNTDPDPFTYWHSSQKRDPGINLALYDNRQADKILEDARQTIDNVARSDKYFQFQQIVNNDLPALFLYSPTYIYPQPIKIKGNSTTLIGTPANRFETVASWYINTTRSSK